MENALRGESPSEDTGPAGGPVPDNNNPDHGRLDRTDDTAAVVVAPVVPDRTDTTTGTFDPPGTWTGGGTGTPRPDLPADPDYSGIQPVILDLDGDGVEIAFGEDIYFDLDDDGFLEQTSWASADDGFLVIDLNADGTRGAGDGVIDQSNELVLSSLGLEGARRKGLASGVVDQGRGLGERF